MTYLRLAERIVLVTLFLTMSGLFFLSVVTREIGGTFASNFAWIEEAVRFMNIFLVFLGLGLALERGKHVGIDTLRDHLSDPARKVLLKVIDASGFLFSAYMAWLGWSLARSCHWHRPDQPDPGDLDRLCLSGPGDRLCPSGPALCA